MADDILIRVRRQDAPDKDGYWEEFLIPYAPAHNVISVLMEIQKNPVTANGKTTTPVTWECNCLEEVCGACTMVINGKVQQACTALIDRIGKSIVLEPMRKFPVVRDLQVNRKRMFDALMKVNAWVPIDGTYDLGPGPRMAPKDQAEGYDISKCMTCGCCMDGCPQFNDHSSFYGPAPIQQVRLYNLHPIGAMTAEARLETIMGEGGIQECGNAQNCVRLCPKEIRITKHLASLNKDVNRYGIFGTLKK